MTRIGDLIGSEYDPDTPYTPTGIKRGGDYGDAIDRLARELFGETRENVIKIISTHDLPFSIDGIDLQQPPGFVGKVVDWINQCSYYHRKNLAVISALTAIGNIAGLKYRDDLSDVTTNLLSICVAGTGTGKDWMISAFKEIMDSVSFGAACCGDMKSKQEIIRNLIEHQAAFYIKDEIGEILRAIENAKKNGGAAYMEGITGEIMAIFTKAGGSLQVGGDVKRDMIKTMRQEMAYLNKQIDEGDDRKGYCAAKLETMIPLYESIVKKGSLPRPFLSLIGFTTMEAFEGSVNIEVVKNGFLNRTIIVEEHETNPKSNDDHSYIPFPYSDRLFNIASTGDSSAVLDRIEYYGEPRLIKTEPDAKQMLENLKQWQWDYAEYHKEKTGYESLARRSYEFISKISTILAIGDLGVRTVDHVKWAAAYIKRDIEHKISLAIYATGKQAGAQKEDVMDSLESRARHLAAHGIFRSALIQKLKRKGIDKTKISNFIDKLIDDGKLQEDGKTIRLV